MGKERLDLIHRLAEAEERWGDESLEANVWFLEAGAADSALKESAAIIEGMMADALAFYSELRKLESDIRSYLEKRNGCRVKGKRK